MYLLIEHNVEIRQNGYNEMSMNLLGTVSVWCQPHGIYGTYMVHIHCLFWFMIRIQNVNLDLVL